jgi:hypothetical protein
MAATVTPQVTSPQGNTLPGVVGGLKYTVNNVAFDATTYVAGGFAVNVGLPNKVLFSTVTVVAPATGAVTGGLGEVFYNNATGKVQALDNTGVEGAFAASLAGLTVQVLAFGY